MNKRCCTCKEIKDIEEFSCKNKKKGIRNSKCKSCHRKYVREHYANNKEMYTERNKRNTKIIKEWFEDFKSTLSCVRCGEDHPATFDFHHRNPNDKELEIGNAVANRWTIPRIMKEIEKCDILCANCHRKLHYDGRKSGATDGT